MPKPKCPKHPTMSVVGVRSLTTGRPLYVLSFNGWVLATDQAAARARLERIATEPHKTLRLAAASGYGVE